MRYAPRTVRDVRCDDALTRDARSGHTMRVADARCAIQDERCAMQDQ
jgi:hypothetical protein